MKFKIKPLGRPKKVKDLNWRKILPVALIIIAFSGLYLWNIGNLPPTDNIFEQPSSQKIEFFDDIKNDVIYAPHKIVNFLLLAIANPPLAYLRLISVSFTLIAVASFYLLVKQWISPRVAALATLLFATSSWILHTARWAEPEAMLLIVFPVILLAGSLLRFKENDKWLPLTTFLMALLLYIPGVWAILLAGVIIMYKDLHEAWTMASTKAKAFWAGSFLIPITPLLYGLTRPGVALEWLGRPVGGLNKELVAENFINMPSQFLQKGVSDAFVWLPGTPVLDGATAVLAVLGMIYVVINTRRPLLRWVLLVFTLLSLILIVLQGFTYISLIMPLIYIFVAFGIALLLQQWFHIFPHNPFARSFSVILVSTVIFIAAFYHVARYHYVWPRAEATKEIFQR